MARKRNSIKSQVIENMKKLGVYSKEYRNTIDIFTDMIYQYEIFIDDFENNNNQVQEEYTNKAGATNMRKTPTYSAIEKLRMDIATYSNLLCLNPKALERVSTSTSNKSTLATILDQLDNNDERSTRSDSR